MIKKVLQPTNDVYIQFTEEELRELPKKLGDHTMKRLRELKM